jgi:hypothetical protein
VINGCISPIFPVTASEYSAASPVEHYHGTK